MEHAEGAALKEFGLGMSHEVIAASVGAKVLALVAEADIGRFAR
jgi:hypothetical protein